MRYSLYKTKKQKIDHINRYWSKPNLLCVLESYLMPHLDEQKCKEEDPESYDIWQDMKNNLKTKKAIINKYLDVIWEIIWEEYSYAY